MTLRQMHAYLDLAGRRRKCEQLELLALHTQAAQGDPKAIKKMIQDA